MSFSCLLMKAYGGKDNVLGGNTEFVNTSESSLCPLKSWYFFHNNSHSLGLTRNATTKQIKQNMECLLPLSIGYLYQKIMPFLCIIWHWKEISLENSKKKRKLRSFSYISVSFTLYIGTYVTPRTTKIHVLASQQREAEFSILRRLGTLYPPCLQSLLW